MTVKWFVFLDEAHKGAREDSKRKAYYSRLVKNGFLFNFSATFTDEDDIVTTVANITWRILSATGTVKISILAMQLLAVLSATK